MSTPETAPAEELIFTEAEFDALLTSPEWPAELLRDPEHGPALAAISQPQVMGGVDVIAAGQSRTHMLWARGSDVAFLIDLGAGCDGVRRVQLTRHPLDALPLLLAEATGTTGSATGAPEKLRAFTEQDFNELFLTEAIAPDVLIRRGWRRAWHVTAMPGHNPDESFEAAGVLLPGAEADEGYLVRGVDADVSGNTGPEVTRTDLPVLPAGGSAAYLEFCRLAALINAATE